MLKAFADELASRVTAELIREGYQAPLMVELVQRCSREALEEIVKRGPSQLVELPDGQWALVKTGGCHISIHKTLEEACTYWLDHCQSRCVEQNGITLIDLVVR